MTSSDKDNIIVDSIHSDIHLNNIEWKVINTPSFQRLRHIKQLQMSHLVYPSATHTRFVHSIGTLAIMNKTLKQLSFDDKTKENLQLASLLHDIGHYPYSHLVEQIGNTKLTEELLGAEIALAKYPKHEKTGEMIILHQKDILRALGDEDKAQKIVSIFTGSNPDLSPFITSSFDLDRMDYLLRDSYATGVPYGRIDINYLLNHVKINDNKIVCLSEKAVPAAEQFLMARFFMYRTVYWHKTTCAMEEACRHLLKRLCDKGKSILPTETAEETFKSDKLLAFTDAYIDRVIQKAVYHKGNEDADKTIRILAESIVFRRPPKLLKEVAFWHEDKHKNNDGKNFKHNLKNQIGLLAKKHNLLPGQFIFCEKAQKIEKEEVLKTTKELKEMSPSEMEKEERVYGEIIKIFRGKDKTPQSLMDRDDSIIRKFEGHTFFLYRLYVALGANDKPEATNTLKKEVKDWHNI
jgi:HD superfamily phosphohydrolase